MAAAHRSSSFLAYANHTNPSVTTPAGTALNDIVTLWFCIGSLGTPPVPTPPAGFTALAGFPLAMSDVTIDNPADFTVRTYAWGKVAGGAEPANYTVTHAAANSSAYIWSTSGADIVTPYDPNPTTNVQTGSAASPATVGGLTTLRDGSLVAFIITAWDVFGASTPPAGATPTFTERLDDATSIIYAADGIMSPQGATGGKSFNLNATQDDAWSVALIAINAAAPAGGGGAGWLYDDLI